MKKLNFNQLKSVKTPESWVENAINIPSKNKKPLPFYFKTYFIASAACIIVCCAVSLTVFLNFNGKEIVPKLPNAANGKTMSSIYNSESEVDYENSMNPSKKNIHDDNSVGFSQTVTDANGKVIATGSLKFSTPPNTANTNKNGSATNATEATEKNTSGNINTTEPKETHYVPPTEVISTTVTTPPHTNASTEKTTSDFQVVENIYYSGVITLVCPKNSIFSSNNSVYCHLVSNYGETYTTKFSSKELCSKSYSNGNLNICYYTKDIFPLGNYRIEFYDAKGHNYAANVLLLDDNVTLSCKK